MWPITLVTLANFKPQTKNIKAHSRGTQGEKYFKGNMMLLEMALKKVAVIVVHDDFHGFSSFNFFLGGGLSLTN